MEVWRDFQDVKISPPGFLVFPKIGILPPKWMVKIMEKPIKIYDLGGFPPIFGSTQMEKNRCIRGK